VTFGRGLGLIATAAALLLLWQLRSVLIVAFAAVVLAMLGTGRLYRWRLRGGGGATFLLVPAGMFVYIAVPPARDFATSGLESGLVICWIALLWLPLLLLLLGALLIG